MGYMGILLYYDPKPYFMYLRGTIGPCNTLVQKRAIQGLYGVSDLGALLR